MQKPLLRLVRLAGIAPSDYEKALGRFSQVGPSAGSGLGLPISKAVVESFGGEIAMKTDDNGFSVTLGFPLNPSQG